MNKQVEALYRASQWCHEMSVIALSRESVQSWKTWRNHARAYASAARIVSRSLHRELDERQGAAAKEGQEPGDAEGGEEAMTRMVQDAIAATDGLICHEKH